MAVCPACKREKNEGLSCVSVPIAYRDGTKGPPRPYSVEKPPELGVPLDLSGINTPWTIPAWYCADDEPKGDLVRVVVMQEKAGPRNRTVPFWTYYPWESRVEAEARLAALVAEHGYYTRPIGAEDDSAAMMARGHVIIEEPICGDCKVPVGGFHHPGCDNEKCPRCSWQLISCGHLADDDDEDEEGEEEEDEAAEEDEGEDEALASGGAPREVSSAPSGSTDRLIENLQQASVPADYAGSYDPPTPAPNYWLVGVHEVQSGPGARVLRIVPVVKHEERIAAQLMIDDGDTHVFAFTRPVTLEELAAALEGGQSIGEAFPHDFRTVYLAEGRA